tara:strand:+ start:3462 stop:4031 length:570 start_codon:yes stop_codon:yes gene_type:complete
MSLNVTDTTSTASALKHWIHHYMVPKSAGEAFSNSINEQGYTTVAALKVCPLNTIIKHFDSANDNDDVPLKGGHLRTLCFAINPDEPGWMFPQAPAMFLPGDGPLPAGRGGRRTLKAEVQTARTMDLQSWSFDAFLKGYLLKRVPSPCGTKPQERLLCKLLVQIVEEECGDLYPEQAELLAITKCARLP